MRVLSVDQAKTCGWSLFDGDKLISYGSKKLVGDKVTYEDVLLPAKKFIESLIKETKADVVVIESVQYQSNQATFSKLSMLLGILICLFKENEILFEVVSATKWKSFCKIKGQRRQEQKQNTIEFVYDEYGVIVDSDTADAIGQGHYAINNLIIKNGGIV